MKMIARLVTILCFVCLSNPENLVAATVTTLHFDENFGPANGLSQSGVLFNFNFNTAPSLLATYGGAFPIDLLLDSPVLSGSAQDLLDSSNYGSLIFNFLEPTHILDFVIALNTTANSFVGLRLFDPLGNSYLPVTIATTTDPGCLPGSCFSEASYSYKDGFTISQAVLDFGGSNAETFAVDNLSFETSIPEPATLWQLSLAAGAALGMGLRKRLAGNRADQA